MSNINLPRISSAGSSGSFRSAGSSSAGAGASQGPYRSSALGPEERVGRPQSFDNPLDPVFEEAFKVPQRIEEIQIESSMQLAAALQIAADGIADPQSIEDQNIPTEMLPNLEEWARRKTLEFFSNSHPDISDETLANLVVSAPDMSSVELASALNEVSSMMFVDQWKQDWDNMGAFAQYDAFKELQESPDPYSSIKVNLLLQNGIRPPSDNPVVRFGGAVVDKISDSWIGNITGYAFGAWEWVDEQTQRFAAGIQISEEETFRNNRNEPEQQNFFQRLRGSGPFGPARAGFEAVEGLVGNSQSREVDVANTSLDSTNSAFSVYADLATNVWKVHRWKEFYQAGGDRESGRFFPTDVQELRDRGMSQERVSYAIRFANALDSREWNGALESGDTELQALLYDEAVREVIREISPGGEPEKQRGRALLWNQMTNDGEMREAVGILQGARVSTGRTVARRMGIEPGDTDYGAVSGWHDAVARFIFDPTIILGKVRNVYRGARFGLDATQSLERQGSRIRHLATNEDSVARVVNETVKPLTEMVNAKLNDLANLTPPGERPAGMVDSLIRNGGWLRPGSTQQRRIQRLTNFGDNLQGPSLQKVAGTEDAMNAGIFETVLDGVVDAEVSRLRNALDPNDLKKFDELTVEADRVTELIRLRDEVGSGRAIFSVSDDGAIKLTDEGEAMVREHFVDWMASDAGVMAIQSGKAGGLLNNRALVPHISPLAVPFRGAKEGLNNIIDFAADAPTAYAMRIAGKFNLDSEFVKSNRFIVGRSLRTSAAVGRAAAGETNVITGVTTGLKHAVISKTLGTVGNFFRAITVRSVNGPIGLTDPRASEMVSDYMAVLPASIRDEFSNAFARATSPNERRVLLRGMLEETLDISGASGTKLGEQIRKEILAVVDENEFIHRYGSEGLDEIITRQGGNKVPAAIDDSELAQKVAMPDLRVLDGIIQRGIWGEGQSFGVLGRFINSYGVDIAMAKAWQPMVLLRPIFPVRASVDEIGLGIFREGVSGFIKARGAMSLIQTRPLVPRILNVPRNIVGAYLRFGIDRAELARSMGFSDEIAETLRRGRTDFKSLNDAEQLDYMRVHDAIRMSLKSENPWDILAEIDVNEINRFMKKFREGSNLLDGKLQKMGQSIRKNITSENYHRAMIAMHAHNGHRGPAVGGLLAETLASSEASRFYNPSERNAATRAVSEVGSDGRLPHALGATVSIPGQRNRVMTSDRMISYKPGDDRYNLVLAGKINKNESGNVYSVLTDTYVEELMELFARKDITYAELQEELASTLYEYMGREGTPFDARRMEFDRQLSFDGRPVKPHHERILLGALPGTTVGDDMAARQAARILKKDMKTSERQALAQRFNMPAGSPNDGAILEATVRIKEEVGSRISSEFGRLALNPTNMTPAQRAELRELQELQDMTDEVLSNGFENVDLYSYNEQIVKFFGGMDVSASLNVHVAELLTDGQARNLYMRQIVNLGGNNSSPLGFPSGIDNVPNDRLLYGRVLNEQLANRFGLVNSTGNYSLAQSLVLGRLAKNGEIPLASIPDGPIRDRLVNLVGDNGMVSRQDLSSAMAADILTSQDGRTPTEIYERIFASELADLGYSQRDIQRLTRQHIDGLSEVTDLDAFLYGALTAEIGQSLDLMGSRVAAQLLNDGREGATAIGKGIFRINTANDLDILASISQPLPRFDRSIEDQIDWYLESQRHQDFISQFEIHTIEDIKTLWDEMTFLQSGLYDEVPDFVEQGMGEVSPEILESVLAINKKLGVGEEQFVMTPYHIHMLTQWWRTDEGIRVLGEMSNNQRPVMNRLIQKMAQAEGVWSARATSPSQAGLSSSILYNKRLTSNNFVDTGNAPNLKEFDELFFGVRGGRNLPIEEIRDLYRVADERVGLRLAALRNTGVANPQEALQREFDELQALLTEAMNSQDFIAHLQGEPNARTLVDKINQMAQPKRFEPESLSLASGDLEQLKTLFGRFDPSDRGVQQLDDQDIFRLAQEFASGGFRLSEDATFDETVVDFMAEVNRIRRRNAAAQKHEPWDNMMSVRHKQLRDMNNEMDLEFDQFTMTDVHYRMINDYLDFRLGQVQSGVYDDIFDARSQTLNQVHGQWMNDLSDLEEAAGVGNIHMDEASKLLDDESFPIPRKRTHTYGYGAVPGEHRQRLLPSETRLSEKYATQDEANLAHARVASQQWLKDYGNDPLREADAFVEGSRAPRQGLAFYRLEFNENGRVSGLHNIDSEGGVRRVGLDDVIYEGPIERSIAESLVIGAKSQDLPDILKGQEAATFRRGITSSEMKQTEEIAERAIRTVISSERVPFDANTPNSVGALFEYLDNLSARGIAYKDDLVAREMLMEIEGVVGRDPNPNMRISWNRLSRNGGTDPDAMWGTFGDELIEEVYKRRKRGEEVLITPDEVAGANSRVFLNETYGPNWQIDERSWGMWQDFVNGSFDMVSNGIDYLSREPMVGHYWTVMWNDAITAAKKNDTQGGAWFDVIQNFEGSTRYGSAKIPADMLNNKVAEAEAMIEVGRLKENVSISDEILDRLPEAFREKKVSSAGFAHVVNTDKEMGDLFVEMVNEAARRQVDVTDDMIKNNKWMIAEDTQLDEWMERTLDRVYKFESIAAKQATNYAYQKMAQFTDTGSAGSLFSMRYRNIFPFWWAEERFLKRFFQTAYQSPEAFQKAQLTYKGLEAIGFFEEDQSGNKIFVYPFGNSFPAFATFIGTLFGADTLRIPSDQRMTGRLDWAAPGVDSRGLPLLGPVGAIPVRAIARTFPDLELAASFALGDIGGNLNTPDYAIVLPPILKRVVQIANSEEVFAAQMFNVAAQMHSAGLTPGENATPQEQQEFRNRLSNWSKIAATTELLLGLVSPAPPNVEIPQTEAMEEFRELSYDLGYEQGFQEWLRRNPDADLYSVFSTQSKSGQIPATRGVFELLNDNEEFFSAYSSVASHFIRRPDGMDNEFFSKAWSEQLVLGLRDYRVDTITSGDLMESITNDLYFQAASREYFEKREVYEEMRSQLAGTPDAAVLDNAWQNFKDQYFLEHPIFAEQLGEVSTQRAQRDVQIMGQALEDETVPDVEHVDKLRKLHQSYLNYESAVREFDGLTQSEVTAYTRQMRADFIEYGHRYSNSNPEIMNAWLRIYMPAANISEDLADSVISDRQGTFIQNELGVGG